MPAIILAGVIIFAIPAYGEEKPAEAGDNGSRTEKSAAPDKAKETAATEKEIDAMLLQLKHKNPELRSFAAARLCEIGPKASRAVPALLNAALNDEQGEVREIAMLAIGEMGNAAASCVPALIAEMKKKDRLRYQIIVALGKIGGGAKAAVNDLLDILKDKTADRVETDKALEALISIAKGAPETISIFRGNLKVGDPDARTWNMAVLSNIGECASAALPDIIKMLEDNNSEIRANAVWAVYRIGAAKPEYIKIFNEKLKDPDWSVRQSAADVISDIGEPAKECVNNLLDGLDDKNNEVQASCAEALGNLAAYAPQAIPKLVKILNSEQAYNAWKQAGHALSKFGDEAIPALVEVMEKKESSYSRAKDYAAFALARIGEKAVPILIRLFREGDERARKSAFDAISSLENKAVQAVPALLEAMEDNRSDTWFKENLIKTLGRIGTSEVVPHLAEWIHDENPDIREAAFVALGFVKIRDAVLTLRDALKDPEEENRIHALFGLKMQGENAAEAVPEILPLLGKPNIINKQHVEATWTIREIGEAAIPKMIPFLKDKSEDMVMNVLELLAEFGPKAKSGMADARELMKRENPQIRGLALMTVAAMDNTPEKCVPMIIEASKDKSEIVRCVAAQLYLTVTDFSKESTDFVNEMLKSETNEELREALKQILDMAKRKNK
jgi:HEAT repeat protein